ncbi:unnamed protein product [Rhodiola kirilowii]
MSGCSRSTRTWIYVDCRSLLNRLTVGPRTYRLTTKAIPSVLLLMRCRSRTCELNKEMSAGHGI